MRESKENTVERAKRVTRMLLTGDLAPLAFSAWLRWNRIEYGYADHVARQDGNSHQHSGGPVLAKVLKTLHVPDGSVALDLGVGMGIAALTLSRYFSSVVGVEISPHLIAIARRNLDRVKVTNVELHCADVRKFALGLEDITHVYMFNPFPESVLLQALANINGSQRANSRRLTIIYKHPVCHSAVVAAGFAHVCQLDFPNSHPFSIYSSHPIQAMRR